MALAVFSANYTPLHPYTFGDDRPKVVARMAGGAEQRAATLSRPLRTYRLLLLRQASDRAAIDTFFATAGIGVTSFLWKDLKDYTRTGVVPSPATSDGVQTVFTLPKTGIYGGDYPVDDGNAILYRAGVAATKTVQTDARTMTASVAPLTGGAMTMDYHYYRRVVLDQPYRWVEFQYGFFRAELTFREVPST